MNKHTHANCAKCPLKNERYLPAEMFDAETSNNLAIVIGDTPHMLAAKKEKVFYGQTRELLFEELENTKLLDNLVYLTYSVACVLPYETSLSDVSSAVDCCKGRIEHELSLCDVHTTLAMGTPAISTFFVEEQSIKVLRGSRHNHAQANEIVVSYNPKSIVYQASNLTAIRDDLNIAAKQFKLLPDTEIIEIFKPFDMENLFNLAQQLPKGSRVCADIETGSLNDPWNHKLLCIQISLQEGQSYIISGQRAERAEIKLWLNKLFALEHLEWWGHNFAFDYWQLKFYGFNPPQLWFDTMIIHYLYDEHRGNHGLKSIAKALLGAAEWEKDIKTYIKKRGDSYSLIPYDVLKGYAARDTDMNLQIIQPVLDLIDEHSLSAYENIIQPAQRVIADMKLGGWLVDVDAIDKLLIEYEEIQNALVYDMRLEVGVEDFNPRSTKQVREYLFDTLQLPVTVRTAKGMPSTGIEAIDKLLIQIPDNKFLKLLTKHRQISKIISTYLIGIKKLLDPQGYLHADFNLIGTVTGRLSAGVILTIPRPLKNKYAAPIRDLFIAPKGYCIVGADYSQAELRVAACEAQSIYWKSVWENGKDLHNETAIMVFGENFTDEERTFAKTFNFGALYGRGPKSIQEHTGWSFKRALAYFQKYKESIPDIVKWQENIIVEVKENNQLRSPFGRTRRFPIINEKNERNVHTEALNYLPQSIANDLCLISLTEIDKWLRAKDLDARLLLMLHDGIYVEARLEDANIIAKNIKRIMENVPAKRYSTFVHFKVDVKIGSSWGDLEK